MDDPISILGCAFFVSIVTFCGTMLFFRPTGVTVSVSGWAGIIALASGVATLISTHP